MINFHDTVMGRRFIEGTIPQLVRVLEKIEGHMAKQLASQETSSPDEDDPLVQKENQFEAEYVEIDKAVAEWFPEDYEQGEAAGMQLCDFTKLLLQELKERRMDSEKAQ